MKIPDALEGREFDWLAEDSRGDFALFSTAGTGFVPRVVVNNHPEHEHFAMSIDSPNWGSENVWDDYSVQGLFVYDWRLYEGPYVRVRTPTCTASLGFKLKIEKMTALPTFNGRFADVEVFGGLEGWNDT